MESVSVFCILCATSLPQTGNRRQLFSASSQPFVPLLTTYASLICKQDVFRDVLPSDGKLCRPYHRRLKRILKLKEESKKSEEELSQLLQGAEANRMTQREWRGADPGDTSPVGKARTPQRHPAEISLAKRRKAVSTPVWHIHRHLHRTPRRHASSTPVRCNIQIGGKCTCSSFLKPAIEQITLYKHSHFLHNLSTFLHISWLGSLPGAEQLIHVEDLE